MAGVTSAVVGGAVAAGSAVAGGIQAHKAGKATKGAQRKAEELQAEQMEQWDQLKQKIPSISDRLYELERFKQVGELTPEMEEAIKQEETELKKIQLDPTYKQAQLDALAQLQEIADAKGITPIERAQLARIQNELGNIEKASRQAILQRAAQMGTLTGGQTVQAQLLASQEAANRGALAGTEIASQAYKRAMDAIAQRGELAGGLREQEYGEQRDVASAQDIINQANVRQQADVQTRNVAARNIAQQENLAQQQRVADLNVQAGQEEARRQAQAKEDYYQDLYRVEAGKSGLLGQQAADQAAIADRKRQEAAAGTSGMLGGIGKIGGSLLDYGVKNWPTQSIAGGSQFTTSGSDLVKQPSLGTYQFDPYKK